MLRLRELMTEDVLTVSPELSLRDAMELFVARHVSGAPVVAGDEVVGVVSMTDLIADALGVNPATSQRDETFEAELWDDLLNVAMKNEREDDAVATYFTDLGVDAVIEGGARAVIGSGDEWNALDERTVSDVMTPAPVCALPPTATIREAAEFMREQGIHRVLVTADSQLLGIVTTMDIARAVADGRLGTNTYVFNRRRDFDPRGWTVHSQEGGGRPES